MIWALIWASVAVGLFWLGQLIADSPSLPRLPRRRPPAPHVPHWARTGHLPPSSAATGRRHRRGASR